MGFFKGKVENRYGLNNPKLIYGNAKPHIGAVTGKHAVDDKKDTVKKFLDSQKPTEKFLLTKYKGNFVMFGYDEKNLSGIGKDKLYMMHGANYFETFDDWDSLWKEFEKNFRNL